MTPPVEEKTGKEGRKDWKLIKALIAGQIVTMIVALGALTIGVSNLSAKADAIQTSRVDSKEDSCHFIKGLAYTAAGPAGQANVTAYIAKTPLVNCVKYAHEGITIKAPEGSPPSGIPESQGGKSQ